MNLSRIFHCSVINVLCFAVVQQLLYLITESSACQQLFYFSFFAAVQQLLYLTRSKALCQQLFKIIFCCPLRNISVSRVSLKIISCCDVFVNNFFIFFLLSFEAVIRFAVSSIILSCWQVFVNSIFYIFFTFLLLLKSQIISCAFPVFLYHICHSYSIANIIIHTFPEVSYLSFSDFFTLYTPCLICSHLPAFRFHS